MSYSKKKDVVVGVVTIQATFNNTIVSVADNSGNVIAWSSAGANGFGGSRKSTAYAAQVAAEKALANAAVFGLKIASVKVKGVGAGREGAIRAISSMVNVTEIIDVTPVPHNGCRPPKRRCV